MILIIETLQLALRLTARFDILRHLLKLAESLIHLLRLAQPAIGAREQIVGRCVIFPYR